MFNQALFHLKKLKLTGNWDRINNDKLVGTY